MKPIFILALQLFIFINLPAQHLTALPEYGKVSRSELEMADCTFEKGAPAMVLFNEGESVFRINLNSEFWPVFQKTEHHIRIKIFNKKGFDYANVKIKYATGNKEVAVRSLSAQTYNLDASGNIVVTKLDKSTVYDKAINARFSEKIFAFPDVKAGSIIEYKYTLDGASEGVWYFQNAIPVKFSRFIIDFPEELKLAFTPYANQQLKRETNKKSGGNYSWYTMEDLPSLPDEPFMSCSLDYLQRIEARLTGLDLPGIPFKNLEHTWPEIIRELINDDDFGKELKRNIPRTGDLDDQLRGVTDPFQQMQLIHKYVRNNMAWNDYDNIWALNGVRAAWKDKKGTSGEINLILINLLKDAGLKASPILVSTVDNGTVNTRIAGYNQFNKVMAYVVIDGKHFVLDATEKLTPSGLLPESVMASEGLLIEKPDSYEWGWKQLWDSKHVKQKNLVLYAEIDEKGIMKGTATVTSADYAKLDLLHDGIDKLKDDPVKEEGVTIDSSSITNENDAGPLVQQFNFSYTSGSANDYHFFATNLFTGFKQNPFIAEERSSDVFFGVNQSYTFNSTFVLPEGYIIEGKPKNIKMMMPDSSIVFLRQSSFSAGVLSMRVELQFNTPIFAIDNYTAFKEFYKKLFDLLNEKVVYRLK